MINVNNGFFVEEDKLTEAENESLEGRFNEEEIKKAVFESYPDGAPGPDGISFMFYQAFREVIKPDLMEMFDDLFHGRLDLYRLNFALITIIPKEKDARTMNKFRPISLLNCSYKTFTRVLTSRMAKVVDRLIASNQTAFIKGRYILESVVMAHKILHSVHHSKSQGFVLKLDYEKAYDKVNWEFLIDILEKRGFGGKWIDWIRCILHRGSVGLTINKYEGEFFQSGKGLRQGDPLSPILFNLVVDVLSRMLQKATNRGLMKGLGNELIEGGVISLQYADDTILLIENNESYARNLKWILTCFELMSGMRINFYKSELVPINIESEGVVNNWRDVFVCPVGAFPIKYLGIPLHYNKLSREDLQPLVDKIIKRIAGWRGKLLSKAGRIILIKTCLASTTSLSVIFFQIS
jgi:hypothetical protein